MNRRQYIMATAVVAGLGGCLGDGDGGSEETWDESDVDTGDANQQSGDPSSGPDGQQSNETGDRPDAGTDSPRALLQAWYEFQETTAGKSIETVKSTAGDVLYRDTPVLEVFILPAGDAEPSFPDIDITVDSVDVVDENLGEADLDERFDPWFEPVEGQGIIDPNPDAQPMSAETKADVAEENALLRASIEITRDGETTTSTRTYLVATEGGEWQLVALQPEQ
jgi:hypothetical protein